MKRIYRSTTDRMLGGVCGGIAEYFNIDPSIVRILAVLLLFFDGFGFLAYLLAWIIFPKKPCCIVPETKTGTPEESKNEE